MSTGTGRKTPRNVSPGQQYYPSQSPGPQASSQSTRSGSQYGYTGNAGPNANAYRKQNPNSPNKKDGSKNKRKKNHRPGFFAWLICLIVACLVVYFLFQLVRINILPVQLLLLLSGILVVLTLLLIMIWLFKTRKPFARYFTGFLVCLIGAGCIFGGGVLKSADKLFEQVTNLTDKQVNTVTVYAMKESEIIKPSDLTAAKKLGTASSADMEGTTGMLDKLHKDGASFDVINYDSVYELVDALYDNEVDAIAFPEIQHDALYEVANDDNKYNALTTFTNVVDHFLYYTDRDPDSINPPDPVANIMTDPFTVLVSGNDSYGSIGTAARSDVNMLVTVNPKTAQVLIVSVPRDAYMTVSCKKNVNACAPIANQQDKLTHTGVYGVATTESTLEDYFNVPINYYVRINFSSLINIIDAIGGIDVNVEPGLEVETFYANGTEGVHAGINHLDGERALAFARERHAYLDGDNQRIRNQSIVLHALLDALLSPKMVTNYPKVMEALSTAFDTNMTANEMKSLLTLELSRFPKWNIQTYSLVGEPSTEYSPAALNYVSATLLGSSEIQEARKLIEDVREGKTIDLSAASQPTDIGELDSDGSGVSGYENALDETANPSTDYSQEYTPNYSQNEEDPYSQNDYGQDYSNPGQDLYQTPGYGSQDVYEEQPDDPYGLSDRPHEDAGHYGNSYESDPYGSGYGQSDYGYGY